MNELKMVLDFTKLTDTTEKKEIEQRYLSDETSVFKFALEVSKYMTSPDENEEDE